ncbi:MAG: thiol-disulfide isomerase/thioredoxin, partial [Flavobacteriales bacterium]
NYRLSLLIITIAAFATSCDYVDFPVIEQTAGYDEAKYGPAPSFENATTAQQIKRVFVEDFTGQQCGNCPEAALLAEQIQESNAGRIDVIGIHSGSLAVSDGNYYTNEFETDEGDFYFAQLSFQVNPAGRVDRAPDASNILAPAQWVEKVDDQLPLEAEVAIQLVTEYVPENNDLNVHVFSELLTDFEGRARMSILITESGIEGPQLDYSVVDDPKTSENEQIVEEYDFHHVLRSSVNGPSGVTVADNESQGHTSLKSYTFSWNSDWVAENCTVVAFVYDDETGRVLNTTSIEL